MAPDEIHDNEYEKFLIVEGECDITVGTNVHHLTPGNYFSIPLHATHSVKVTSKTPCKVILQRVAA
jgi:mannose-6-phosphate isomerase-like protein (cupin superfamily)